MTKTDLIKKHETNIKSAFGLYALHGILGLIYIVRYLLKGNLDFYFSIFSTEFLLLVSEEIKGQFIENLIIPCYISAGVITILYALFGIIALKKEIGLKLCLGLYLFDFLVLILVSYMFIIENIMTDSVYINIIVHFIISLFLIVGVWSQKKIKTVK